MVFNSTRAQAPANSLWSKVSASLFIPLRDQLVQVPELVLRNPAQAATQKSADSVSAAKAALTLMKTPARQMFTNNNATTMVQPIIVLPAQLHNKEVRMYVNAG